jgi:hypothetical protein
MMNAAAPDGTPPRRFCYGNSPVLPAPPCLGEALRRVILQKYPYFWRDINNKSDFQPASINAQNRKRKFFTTRCGKEINSNIFVKNTSIFVVSLVKIFRKLAQPKTI